MSTATARHAASRHRVDHTRLAAVLTGLSVVLTTTTGLVVGWFAVAFQLFGARADADDYAVAAGGYGAATVALLLGAVALRGRASRWQLPTAVTGAVVLGLLAVRAVADASAAEPGGGTNSWWDGAGGVAACPWVWWLVVVGVRALVTGGPAARTRVSG